MKRIGESLGYSEQHYLTAIQRLVGFYNPLLLPALRELPAVDAAKFLLSLKAPVPLRQQQYKDIQNLVRMPNTDLRFTMTRLETLANGYYVNETAEQRRTLVNQLMIKGLQAFTTGQTNLSLRTTLQHDINTNQVSNHVPLTKAAILSEAMYGSPTEALPFSKQEFVALFQTDIADINATVFPPVINQPVSTFPPVFPRSIPNQPKSTMEPDYYLHKLYQQFPTTVNQPLGMHYNPYLYPPMVAQQAPVVAQQPVVQNVPVQNVPQVALPQQVIAQPQVQQPVAPVPQQVPAQQPIDLGQQVALYVPPVQRGQIVQRQEQEPRSDPIAAEEHEEQGAQGYTLRPQTNQPNYTGSSKIPQKVNKGQSSKNKTYYSETELDPTEVRLQNIEHTENVIMTNLLDISNSLKEITINNAVVQSNMPSQRSASPASRNQGRYDPNRQQSEFRPPRSQNNAPHQSPQNSGRSQTPPNNRSSQNYRDNRSNSYNNGQRSSNNSSNNRSYSSNNRDNRSASPYRDNRQYSQGRNYQGNNSSTTYNNRSPSPGRNYQNSSQRSNSPYMNSRQNSPGPTQRSRSPYNNGSSGNNRYPQDSRNRTPPPSYRQGQANNSSNRDNRTPDRTNSIADRGRNCHPTYDTRVKSCSKCSTFELHYEHQCPKYIVWTEKRCPRCNMGFHLDRVCQERFFTPPPSLKTKN